MAVVSEPLWHPCGISTDFSGAFLAGPPDILVTPPSFEFSYLYAASIAPWFAHCLSDESSSVLAKSASHWETNHHHQIP